jgi:hypothetical protein
MKCRRFKKVVYLFLKKELSSDEMTEAKKHLAQCPECKKLYLRLDALTARTGHFLKSIKTEEYFRLSDIEENIIPSEKNRRFPIPVLPAVSAAALLFAVIFFFLIMRDGIQMEKPLLEKSDYVDRKEIADSSHQDVGAEIKAAKKTETTIKKMESVKTADEDGFRESYKKWLDERKSVTKPTMLVVIHQNPAIREIHFLNN